MANDLPQIVETVFAVSEDHIVAKARGHDNFFDGIDGAQPLQQSHERPVVDLEAGADRGKQAAFVPAGAFGEFFGALKPVHVRGRAADVGDGAFEGRVGGKHFGLPHDRIDAAILDGSPLVHGDGAEMTLAVTTPVGGQGKTDGVKGCNPACLPVPGMEIALELQAVDRIEFRGGQRWLRRIVDKKAAVLLLDQGLGRHRIVVVVKGPEHRDEGLFIGRSRLVGGQHQGPFRRGGGWHNRGRESRVGDCPAAKAWASWTTLRSAMP